ncbi:hypothetical protein [Faecalispora anaeroviscerum]|uniref:hypothetical protein n=1 Tax=Faecalispora anaeroviscerum TaxID=2991836 RepID=UPI0024BAD4BB|nr:hypothetical protein [Faecalispora anaeroviscerum]
MNADDFNEYSYLDQIRINEGADQCKSTLNELFQKDIRRAVTLLNDNRLMFPCLYILHEPILRQRTQRYLNTRNMTALQITNQIRDSKASGTDYLSSKQNSVYPVLKWILETGFAEEIPEDDYEEILDVAVSVLINIYHDADILPLVVDLIFKRNRNGRYIHDLVWALFRFHDPEVLKLIAQRLRSSDPKDADLAAELLNIDKTGVPAAKGDGEGRYEGYLHWLEENQPYLYFTEESFQYSSKPMFCAVDLERKYLQKGFSSYEKQPIDSFNDEENKSIAAFKQVSVEEQKALSEYSQKICSKSVPAWKEWLHAPVREQIRAAKAGSEGDK